MDYIGKTMICDIPETDGNVKFYKEYFEFLPRNGDVYDRYHLRIFYRDIIDIQAVRGIKSTLYILTNDQRYCFRLYKVNTLQEILEQARREVDNPDIVDVPVEEKQDSAQIKNDDISKIERLYELFKSGALTEEEFLKEKQKILK